MFIARDSPTSLTSSVGAKCSHVTPTELTRMKNAFAYKHVAPTELKRS